MKYTLLSHWRSRIIFVSAYLNFRFKTSASSFLEGWSIWFFTEERWIQKSGEEGEHLELWRDGSGRQTQSETPAAGPDLWGWDSSTPLFLFFLFMDVWIYDAGNARALEVNYLGCGMPVSNGLFPQIYVGTIKKKSFPPLLLQIQ